MMAVQDQTVIDHVHNEHVSSLTSVLCCELPLELVLIISWCSRMSAFPGLRHGARWVFLRVSGIICTATHTTIRSSNVFSSLNQMYLLTIFSLVVDFSVVPVWNHAQNAHLASLPRPNALFVDDFYHPLTTFLSTRNLRIRTR